MVRIHMELILLGILLFDFSSRCLGNWRKASEGSNVSRGRRRTRGGLELSPSRQSAVSSGFCIAANREGKTVILRWMSTIKKTLRLVFLQTQCLQKWYSKSFTMTVSFSLEGAMNFQSPLPFRLDLLASPPPPLLFPPAPLLLVAFVLRQSPWRWYCEPQSWHL